MAEGGAADDQGDRAFTVTEGPFAGWQSWSFGADPFETNAGPFYFRMEGEVARCAFQPRREHMNGIDTIHGGLLMAFVDFALFAIARNALAGSRAVTLTCNHEFLSAGDLNGMIEARGEVLRNARSVIFVRGLVTQVSRPLLAFSGTLKKINTVPRG